MDKSSQEYKDAKKRVDDKKSFFMHVMIYLLVNAGLFALDVAQGGDWWFYWAAIGWGIGLVIHAAVFLLESSILSKDWEQREIEKAIKNKK